MNKGKIKLPHTCPTSGKIANKHQEIEERFGFRNMNTNEMRAQSWCKKCRSKKK